MSVLLDAALDYAARGWPVFPIGVGSKLPAIGTAHPEGDPLRGVCRGECGRDGHGFYDASTDTERVNSWWRAYPKANIGLRTGVAFDVVDIDSREALDALNVCRADRPMTYGPEVATPRGWHLWHAVSGHGNKAGLIGGVDYRGAGGYVVAPPSVRPEGNYAWAPGAGIDEALEPLPAWLLELLAPPRAHRSPSTNGGAAGGTYGRRALEAEVGRLFLARNGERNHALNRAAFCLGQLVAGGELDRAEVVAALVAAGESIGLGTAETEASIRSGLYKGMSQARKAPNR